MIRLFAATCVVIGALSGFIAGRATAAPLGDPAYTGWTWDSPTMTIVDASSARIPADVIAGYEDATGVAIRVVHHRRLYCGPDGDRAIYGRWARRGRVVVCDMGRAPFLNAYTDSWVRHWRVDEAVMALRHLPRPRARRNTFCHELGHAFGLDHWDDAARMALPMVDESCTSGTADGLGIADVLRLRAVYRGGMDPRDPATTAYVLSELGCDVADGRVTACHDV